MTAFGKIESFDATKENWETYVEREEQFLLANDIDDDHKVQTLLSLIGGKTYTQLRDLLAPEKPATKSFQQIVTTLQEHLSPKPLGNCGKISFLQEKPTRRRKRFFLRGRAKEACGTLQFWRESERSATR